jgi:zinc metalloprotease ZmpA
VRRSIAAVAAAAAVVSMGIAAPAAAGAPAPAGGSGAGVLAARSAAVLVARRAAVLRAGPGDVFVRGSVISSREGLQYVPYRRTYRGLPVYGGDFVVVTDPEGRVLSTSVAQTAPIAVATVPARGATDAVAAARAATAPIAVAAVSAPRLVVYALGSPRLAWETVLSGHIGDRPSTVDVFVDAQSGAVLARHDEVADGAGWGAIYGRVTIQTGQSASRYVMADPTRPGIWCGKYATGEVLTGPDDKWGNGQGTLVETDCVDAMFGAQRAWDMFGTWFARRGIDGLGHGYPILVGLDEENAFWSGSYVAIGHNLAGRYIGSLDVVGHEYGHALDETTPGGSAGNGVAEATGDIIGTAAEFFANSPNDPPDFTIGEEDDVVGTGPIRVMYDPALLGDPACYSPAIPTMDEHAAAGPLDHWFTLLAKGSAAAGGQPASPTCDGSTVTGLGIRTAAQVFYNAMLSKTTAMDYPRYRTATLNAAKNLFPATCGPFSTVRAAWNAIGVPAQPADPTCSPSRLTVAPCPQRCSPLAPWSGTPAARRPT